MKEKINKLKTIETEKVEMVMSKDGYIIVDFMGMRVPINKITKTTIKQETLN